jgi:hypothetical protein
MLLVCTAMAGSQKCPRTSSADLNLNGDTGDSEVESSQDPDNQISLFSFENCFLLAISPARALRKEDFILFDVLRAASQGSCSWLAETNGRTGLQRKYISIQPVFFGPLV